MISPFRWPPRSPSAGLACFAGGCCYGTVTSLPWGVDFGDGADRHPSQLYESAFHLRAAVVLYQFQRRDILPGRLIRVYFVAYCLYRFLTEFIRPEPGLWLGLTGYQWAALALLPVLCRVALSDVLSGRGGRRRARRHPARRPRFPGANLLKETWTLCPECLRSVAGTDLPCEDGRVYLRTRVSRTWQRAWPW